ncbi:MAG: GrpB family protein [Pseudomonadota bacterium]
MKLGLAPGSLRLVPYDPAWVAEFERLSTELLKGLPFGVSIHHIGSTAVPGLAAKPILDMAMAAAPTQHDAIASALTRSSWIDRGERSGRLFIRQTSDHGRTHNLHLYAPDAPELLDQLVFRDRLKADSMLRDTYAAHKQALIDGGCPRGQYAEAKTDFIRSALDRP